jgi:hypothetical protein
MWRPAAKEENDQLAGDGICDSAVWAVESASAGVSLTTLVPQPLQKEASPTLTCPHFGQTICSRLPHPLQYAASSVLSRWQLGQRIGSGMAPWLVVGRV